MPPPRGRSGESWWSEDPFEVEFAKPPHESGLYGYDLASYQADRGAAWQWVFDRVQGGLNRELTEYTYNRWQASRDCGRHWKVYCCTSCGTVSKHGATPMYACNSWACPTCAPTKARKFRRALMHYGDTHRVVRRRGRVSRGYFLWTLTVPSKGISVRDFQAQRAELKRLVDTVWQKVWRFRWRKDGDEWVSCGRVDDAGALVVFEVGPHGNLHAHVLVYGAWCPVSVARELVIAKAGGEYRHLDVQAASSERGRISPGAVRELSKYLTKVSSGPAGNYTHPLIGVLFELACAFPKAQRIMAKGSVRGFQKALREADDDPGELVPCARCGGLDFDRVERHGTHPFIPWETGPPAETAHGWPVIPLVLDWN